MNDLLRWYHSLDPAWSRLLTAALVLLIGATAVRLSDSLIGRLFRAPSLPEERARRLRTLGTTLRSVVRYAVSFVVLTTVLSALGVPTASILAGAGIVGLAVGFGAQNLVRDVITGFFIILEDQYGVGDYVTVADVSGVVEEIGLRTTRLRDFGGELHVIPNGIISKSTNHSRGAMRAQVDVTVAYEEDLEHVLAVLERVCQEVADAMAEKLREKPTVLGVTAFAADGVTLRLVARAAPLQQWEVERELRRRIKIAFDREGIEIPYARRVQVPAAATKAGRLQHGRAGVGDAGAQAPAGAGRRKGEVPGGADQV